MQTIQPGIYRHYKGNFYRVHRLVKHSETLEDLVLYEALYDNPRGHWWVRPAGMFAEEVEVDGQKRPRFELVKAEPEK